MKKIVVYISTVVFGVFLVFTVYLIKKPKPVLNENSEKNLAIPGSLRKQEATEEKTDSNSAKYQISEYNGNIAVFVSEKNTPVKITSVSVKELPLADQKLLKEGIFAYTEEELSLILEDYCS